MLGPAARRAGPPISAGPQRYPADVTERLAADAAADHRAAIRSRARRCCRCCTWCRPRTATSLRPGSHSAPTQLGLTGAEVTAVATFYSMYRRDPTGDYLVGVCTNTLCAVHGRRRDPRRAARTTSASAHGETTADGKITLEHIECNAACDYAPVIMVNWEFFDNQTPDSARELVDELRDGEPVTPTRGAAAVHVPRDRPHPGRFRRRAPRRHDGPGRATLAGLRSPASAACSAARADVRRLGDGPDDERDRRGGRARPACAGTVGRRAGEERSAR